MQRYCRYAVTLLLALAAPAYAGTAVLTWTAPTLQVGGAPLTNLEHFAVYRHCSTDPLPFETFLHSTPVNVLTYTDTVPDDGRTCTYTLTAVDALASESAHTNPLAKTFPVIAGPAPGAITYALTWTVTPTPIGNTTRYVRLTATSEVNGNPWTTAAEVNVLNGVTPWPRAATTVDSQDPTYPGTHATDGDPATFWHSQYSSTTTPLPHWIVIDLGQPRTVNGLSYLPRQDGANGTIRNFTVDVSPDGTTWTRVATSTFTTGQTLKLVGWPAR